MCGCTDLGHDDVRRLIVARSAEVHPGGHAGTRMEDLLRLRQMPPGAQLLSHLRLAGRIRRRRPVALHQRARPRQHPEGRHLFGRAAHVGRHDLGRRAARHCRCGRQVRRSRRSRSPAASASTCSASRRRICPPSGPISTRPAWSPAPPMPRALRTVKTCVGTDWCRFGTQDSTGLGMRSRSSCGAHGRRPR